MLSQLSEMGINVVEAEETEEAASGEKAASAEGEEEESEGGEVAEVTSTRAVAVATTTKEPTDRTDDPVRMYLREMGSVELLSREGEIAIAKRIEAGREAMIAGLCESPLTFQAIIIWRDELVEGKVLLRDIIDLEATYAGPDGKNAPQLTEGEGEGDEDSDAPTPPDGGDEEDDLENNVSLAAMEAEIKPRVLETFDAIASNYHKLRKHQADNVPGEKTTAQAKKQGDLKDIVVTDVKSLSLNNNRIEALVGQLYAINKQLIGHEGRLMRYAESHGVARDEFLRHYQGYELDPNWMERVGTLGGKGWREPRRAGSEAGHGAALADSRPRLREGPGDRRVPPHREHGSEGRARSPAGQEGNDRGEPAPRDLHRQEIHEPRPAVPGPDPGGQHRPDEGRRISSSTAAATSFRPTRRGGSGRRSRARSPIRRGPSASRST